MEEYTKLSPSESSELKQSTKIGPYEFNDSTVTEFCIFLLYFQNKKKSVKQSIINYVLQDLIMIKKWFVKNKKTIHYGGHKVLKNLKKRVFFHVE